MRSSLGGERLWLPAAWPWATTRRATRDCADRGPATKADALRAVRRCGAPRVEAGDGHEPLARSTAGQSPGLRREHGAHGAIHQWRNGMMARSLEKSRSRAYARRRNRRLIQPRRLSRGPTVGPLTASANSCLASSGDDLAAATKLIAFKTVEVPGVTPRGAMGWGVMVGGSDGQARSFRSIVPAAVPWSSATRGGGADAHARGAG